MNLTEIEKHYSESIKKYGTVSKGVGWNNEEGQILRFQKLLSICPPPPHQESFSVNELGCGYGALYRFLQEKKYRVDYVGYDISEEMLHIAKEYTNNEVSLICSDRITQEADYSITSGIFNAKFSYDDKIWLEYILEILHNMNEMSRKGFSFNMLTNFVDYKNPNLYYADPNYFFDYVRKNFSKNLILLHDYDLWEWTILVRK